MDPLYREQPAPIIPLIKLSTADSDNEKFAMTNSNNKIHPYTRENKISEAVQSQPQPQPQPQDQAPHEWLGQQQHRRQSRSNDTADQSSPPDKRVDLASLADRVRAAQLTEQKQQPKVVLSTVDMEQQLTERSHSGHDSPSGHQSDHHPPAMGDHRHHRFHFHLAPPGSEDKDEIKDDNKEAKEITSSDEEESSHHHHRFRLGRHNSSSSQASAKSHESHRSKLSFFSRKSDVSTSSSVKKRAILFPKMLNKECVRNAIAMRKAAGAFQNACRAENLMHSEISEPMMAVTGTAIPALFMRRDDKGRRPPPVFFHMVKLAITDSEIDLGVSKQIIFRVELQYGDIKWVIRRSLYEFYKLHLMLSAKRFEGLPKFPGQLSQYAFQVAKAAWKMKIEDRIEYLRQNNLTRRKLLQEYMCQLLHQVGFNSAYNLYEFLEISALSVTKGMGWKGKEGYLHYRATNRGNSFFGLTKLSKWAKSWVMVRDSYVVLTETVGSDEPTDVFLFDASFFVHYKEKTFGMKSHHIEFGNNARKFELRGGHTREMIEWMYDFEKIRYYSSWLAPHRFGSFAPEREDAKVKMYVDGKDYFHAVSDAILAARREIYICDWWLSPELYLRRPPEKNREFRLDRLLKRKAMEGVMIYVVVYKEVSLALTLDSAHTKIWLQDLHRNIQVQRHPDHVGVTTTMFWAHHEKICVIDCQLAFIGGLDLCFGRYDTGTHQLSDYHPSGHGTIWPGQDYNNPRIKDFVNVKDYNTDLIEKKLLSRMPWHDVSLAVVGQAARDIARHFVQRWNFVKREKGMRKSHMKFLMPKGEFDNSRNETNWTGSQKVQVLRSSCGWSQGVELECSIQNAYISSILKSKHFIYIENQFFVTLGTEGGNPDIKNRIGIAIVERILRAFREGTRFRVIVVMPLMPAFEADIMTSDAGTLRKVMHYQYQSICRGGHSILERILSHGIDPFEYIGFYGLRSYDRIKHGKFDAIVEAIKEAELDDGTSLGNTLATTAVTNDLCKKNSRNELGKKNSRNELSKKASKGIGLCPSSATQENTELDHPDGLAPRKSLAAKFLLEEIPKGKEAERIIAISERRREYDRQRTWDESISKRAMNPAKEELGYVPATTSEALADKETTAQVARETLKAEADAIEKGYRQSGRTSPEITEGVGTAIRNVIEGIKGTKDDGNLKPLGQRLRDTKDLNIDGLGKKKHHLRQNIKNAFRGYDDEFFQSELDAINDTEKIVEPGLPKHTVIETDSNSSPEDSTTVDAGESTDSLRLRPNSTIEETASSIGDDSSSIGDILMPPNVKNMPSSNRRQKRPKKPRGPVVDDEVDDFVTELLYIHSKLMIVDDRIIICGSANLNDRSQLGVRDSEIAIYIEDTEMIDSKMDGKPYLAGKLAHGLRTSLFKEHLGLLPHVGHDVITKNSVLPVDLDAPDKDPELQRDELIRKANENLGRDLKNQQRNQQYDQRQPYPSRSTSSHGVDDSGIGSSNGLHDSGIGSSNGLYDSGIGSSNGVHSTDLSSSDIGGSGTSSSSSSTNGGTGVNNNSQPGISLNKGEIHHLAEDKEMGDIKAYIPDPEEIKDIKRWQSTSEMVHKEAKILTADDPAAADLVVRDPLNDDFYLGWWKRVAKTNTLIFREVFRCVPDDTVENWDQYKAFIPNPKKVLAGHVALEGASAKEVKERLKNITGHLVEFPLKFLYEENLIGAAESAVVPMEIFT